MNNELQIKQQIIEYINNGFSFQIERGDGLVMDCDMCSSCGLYRVRSISGYIIKSRLGKGELAAYFNKDSTTVKRVSLLGLV